MITEKIKTTLENAILGYNNGWEDIETLKVRFAENYEYLRFFEPSYDGYTEAYVIGDNEPLFYCSDCFVADVQDIAQRLKSGKNVPNINFDDILNGIDTL